MPQIKFLALTVLAVMSASASSFAGDCDIPAGAPYSAKNKKQDALNKAVNKHWQEMKGASALTPPNDVVFFVIPDESGEKPKIIETRIDPQGSLQELSPEVMNELHGHAEIQLHNHSTFSSLYFFPSTKTGLKDLNPLNACAEAHGDARHSQGGCTKVSLGARDKVTLLYDQSANKCDEIVFLQGLKKRTDQQGEHLRGESAKLAKAFGTVNGQNRRPAGGERPTIIFDGDPKINSRTLKKLEADAATLRRPTGQTKARDAANSN